MSKWHLDMKANDRVNGKLVVTIYRFGNWLYYDFRVPVIRQLLWGIYKVLNLIIAKGFCSADIPASSKIGSGLYLAHGGSGVVVHERAVIGERVSILQQVTIGENSHHRTHPDDSPVIGNDVYIGAGAKVVGKIKIGDHAIIGANAVVLTNVPEIARAVGVPARIIESTEIIYTRHSPSVKLKK
ncbi:serine acetyltransferase [Sporolactobacillus shoreicorticis]|uniref:Serine acetyltransferase n=1 Tax=Sporolactobacillus shoreicorticis TaxID=1923877 RepID=A0ABW5S603_9BACL|nr:serine acetyltransferase [Sporolactobacillus shoreicorticis]MCO7127063.1 serine acetyltransferase [Sporolactobacillus shoreicorticis]